MLSFGLKLLGIGKWLREAAASAFRWITTSTVHMLIAALAAALLWGAWERRTAGKWRRAYDIAMTAQKASEAASKANAAAAIAQVKATEAKSAQIAKETQHEYETDLAAARDAAARYSDAHRVRVETVYRSPAPSASQDHPAERDSGAGSDAFMVAVKREDIDICTENTAKLQAAHQWGQSLVDQGLARWPEPAFGQ